MKITWLVLLVCSLTNQEVLGCGWGVVPSVPGPLPPIGPPGPGGEPGVILPDFNLPGKLPDLDLVITDPKWEFMNAILRQFNNRQDLLVLSSYDLNGDAIVHISEIVEKLEITDEETVRNVNEAFVAADHNRDGALSCQEFYWAKFWKPKMRESILKKNQQCGEPARQRNSGSSATTTTKSTSKAVQEASSTTSHHYRGDDELIMKSLPPGLHNDVQLCLKEYDINDHWNDSFIKAVACVGNKQEQMYVDLKNDLNILIRDLKKQRNNLMLEVDQLQQNVFRYDLIIEGITEPFVTNMFNNSSANKEMKKLGEAELGVISAAADLGVNLTKDSIEYAKRTGSRNGRRSKRRAILVRFSCLMERNALHQARKRVANGSSIKIKHHLTHRRKRLLKKVKRKKPLVQKAWVNDGNIFVLTNNYDVVEVHSLDDLNKYQKQSH